MGAGMNHRVLFVSHGCYLEPSIGASVASRGLMECLARHGFAAEALSGTVLNSGGYDDPAAWLAERGVLIRTTDPVACGRRCQSHRSRSIRRRALGASPGAARLAHREPVCPCRGDELIFINIEQLSAT
jgi:hypothetical protein